MYEIYSCVAGEHNLLFVLAAVLVLTLGSVCSVIVYHRGVLATNQLRHRIWAGISGTVTAVGIWATHFVAMLGYRPGFAVEFDGVTTLLSAVIAISGFFITSQILVGKMSLFRRLLCAGLATATVAAMHYYGAGALKSAALIELDTTYVVTSMVVGGVFFTLTYLLLSKSSSKRNIGALVCSLLAVASLHFIGMTAVDAVPMKGFAEASWAINPATLGTWVVMGVALIILAASFAAGMDTVVARFRFREARRIALLVNAASEAILITRADGEIVEVNDSAATLFAHNRQALLGQNVNTLMGSRVTGVWSVGTEATSERTLEVGGVEIPVDVSIRSLEEEGAGLMAVSLYDLRERMRQEAHIRKLAYKDQLTDLPNRAAFQKELTERTSPHAPVERDFSVFLVDLDEFKDVNDQFGHEAGDAVLIEAGERLRETFGKKALVSRLGGDEFAVLYPHASDVDALMELGESCVSSLSRPIRYGAIGISSSASVGIATGTMWEDPATLMKAADRALYDAKKAGRNMARFYDEALHSQAELKRALESDLEAAVRNEEFVLHYQSKVCSDTREILGYEALIRWERPGHGLVLPGHFIEVAEQSLIIQEIGRWCLYEACRAAAAWEEPYSVSVNLSARQFLDPTLYPTVRDALRKSGLAAERLELEITETALIQNTIVAGRILTKLKKLGVQVALDDFGTGYSSLRFVQQFPFDRIKIDRSFVSSMGEDRKAYAVIDAILRLGETLSIPVVAEGVETEEQAMRLIQSRCSELQGFLISRPGPLTPEGRVRPAVSVAS